MKYGIKDMVKFYPNVTTNQIFIGEIVEVYMGMNQYKIMYEGSKFCVHEQFIIEKASVDEIKIVRYELKLAEKDLMIKELKDTVGKFITQLQAQVDVNIDNDKKIDGLCKDKAALELIIKDCHDTIVDLKYKVRKFEADKSWKKGWEFPYKKSFPPIKKPMPWSTNCNISGDRSKSCGCHVKSS
jgi:hypothetical protein